MTSSLRIALRRLPHGEGLPTPAYASAGAAGMDLYAALAEGQKLVLEPGARDLTPTGMMIALPEGYEAQVRPRSGLAVQHGVTVLNAPGTIDSDYRGPLGVALVNLGAAPYVVSHGDRIAQCVIAPVLQAGFEVVDELDSTARGAGGFGSTGMR